MKHNLHIPHKISIITNSTHSIECRYIHKFGDIQVLAVMLKIDTNEQKDIYFI